MENIASSRLKMLKNNDTKRRNLHIPESISKEQIRTKAFSGTSISDQLQNRPAKKYETSMYDNTNINFSSNV